MGAILGIETSCDETAVATLSNSGCVLSHELLSQKEHSSFGGVVPEVAARAHFAFLHLLISKAMDSAALKFCDLDAVAVTAGPGLVGSLIVGVMMGKAVAYATQKKIIGVNHLEAHALVARMESEVEFPFLVLIISGGHCQFLIAHEVGRYSKLGGSIDDSLGEAFDKVARMLGLGYPGGPLVEQYAAHGRGDRFSFPRALQNKAGCDFSFSGLKTAVRNVIAKESSNLNEQLISDVCASFQECVGEILSSRIGNAIFAAKLIDRDISSIVVTGGVAANSFLRNKVLECVSNYGLAAVFPARELCTDNGIMVAWAGLENLRVGRFSSLELSPRARWPLESIT